MAKHTTEVDLLLRDHADLQKARKELDAEETQLRKLSSDTRTIEEVSQKYQQLQATAYAPQVALYPRSPTRTVTHSSTASPSSEETARLSQWS